MWNDPDEEEKEEVVNKMPTLSSVAAISYLDELREFALFHHRVLSY